jgi:methyltransferase (TIGR00027 family)
VAAARTLGAKLPVEARLVSDPYGASFAGSAVAALTRFVPGALTLPMWPFALYMQVRTRVIDDVVRDFVRAGGRQVLILGAGYDCRATRLGVELGAARVFEIDHPATQAQKRSVLARSHAASAPVTYIEWDFEKRPAEQIPEALAAEGHAPSLPTLTIWEGVTMYLTELAIESTFRAVRALSAEGSPFVMTYFERSRIERPDPFRALVSNIVARRGEPFRFGWHPSQLPAWTSSRGFTVEWDRTMVALASSLLPAPYARAIQMRESRIALLRRGV